jgi:hypothetical protein
MGLTVCHHPSRTSRRRLEVPTEISASALVGVVSACVFLLLRHRRVFPQVTALLQPPEMSEALWR